MIHRYDGYCSTHRKCKSVEVYDNVQFRRKNFYYQRYIDHSIVDCASVSWHRDDIQGLYFIGFLNQFLKLTNFHWTDCSVI